VIDHGQKAGKSPEEIAEAAKKWRDKARTWGEENFRETDPNKWFAGNRKLDARIRDELAAIQGREATERIATEIRDPGDRQRFAEQYAQSNGDPNAFEEGSPARSLAEILNQEVFQSPKFTLPGGGSGPMPFSTEAGVPLGDFETQIRPEGDLDVVIRVDDEEKGSVRKAITIPEITDEDIEAAFDLMEGRGFFASVRKSVMLSGNGEYSFDGVVAFRQSQIDAGYLNVPRCRTASKRLHRRFQLGRSLMKFLVLFVRDKL
jgi:hypothetical protein